MNTSASQASVVELSNPPGLYDPSPNGYSHVATLPASARLIFIAGQGGDTESGEFSPQFQQQVRQAFRNLRTAVESTGARMKDIAKLTVLIVGHNEEKRQILSAELAVAFGAGPKSPCTLIPVPCLALESMLFEVEAVAATAA